MNHYPINTSLTRESGGIKFIATPDRRNIAWETITKYIGQKTCRLVRIDDTAFMINSSSGYDHKHCLHIALVAALIANDININYAWRRGFDFNKVVGMPYAYSIGLSNIDPLSFDSKKLVLIWKLLLEKYSSEKIELALQGIDSHLISIDEADKLVQEIRSGYAKLKFAKHNILYILFSLQNDLEKLDDLLKVAIQLQRDIYIHNLVNSPTSKYAVRSKWHFWEMDYEHQELDNDLKAIVEITQEMDLKRLKSGLEEKISNIRNEALRLIPLS